MKERKGKSADGTGLDGQRLWPDWARCVLIHLPGRLGPLELRAVSKRNEQGADDPGLDRD